MPHRLNGQYGVKGITLAVEVSPCCWMYPGYPMQVKYLSTDGRSWGYVADQQWAENTATREDVQQMLERHLSPEPCDKCRHTHLFNDTDKTGKEGKASGARLHTCEVCFLAKLDAEMDQIMAAERDEVAENDRKMKRQGCTHRVTAWVHPNQGDDRQVYLYMKGEPTAAQIQAELRKLRSVVLDDYTIHKLN